MIGTELINGQGLGNQLLAYVTARAIARERGCEFGICNPGQLGNNIHSQKGMYFMDIDCGREITQDMKADMQVWNDDDTRLYLGNSRADMNHGVYISGADKSIHQVPDNTLLMGNLQAEDYFGRYRDEIRDWLRVKPEYDSAEYTRDNLCIINMRGGEYTGSPELYLGRKYFIQAMNNMKKIRSDMEFMVVTEDEEAARKVLPEIPAHHFDMGKDYVTVKNARYLILSNSSFAILPVLTSETLQYVIAPKYWARYNVSDGYWASEQNIYSFMNYQDRRGRLFTADECRAELEEYKKRSSVYARRNQKQGSTLMVLQNIRAKYIYYKWMGARAFRKIERML